MLTPSHVPNPAGKLIAGFLTAWLAAHSLEAFPQGTAPEASTSSPSASPDYAGSPDSSGTGGQEPDVQTLAPVTVTAGKVSDSPPGALNVDARDMARRRSSTSDTARLLEDIPGVSSYGAGGISSLPAVHGLADDRLRTLVDGMDLMTACPNHMNPALSFIDPSKVKSVEVYAGIAPVSVGGDSIGGTIQVNSAPPKFAKPGEGLLAEGEAGMYTRSNNNARGKHVRVMAAGERFNLGYVQSGSESDNYWAAGDFKKPGTWKTITAGRTVDEREVGATEYRGSVNRELSLALRPLGNHVVALSFGEQRLDYEGFPNQRMDMVSSVPDPADPFSFSLDKGKPSNVNRLTNLRYTGQYGWGELEARLFHQNLRHHMDMLPERFGTMMMPMDTVATTDGGLLKGSIDLTDTSILRVGGDFQKYRLDDWWPPITGISMCCEDFWNIRDGKRDRIGLFAEWEARWDAEWLTLLGIRGGTVKSDAGPVQGYGVSYAGDAASFNDRDRYRKDNHLDLTALARYAPDATLTFEAGVARKTRSPNLYERYPWSFNSMAALMNNFVGDGNAYIGNPDLQPEIAHTLGASGDWHDADSERWNLKVTGYLTHVEDFIDARRCTPSMNIQCNATNPTTTNRYVKLQYVNQTARLHGFDVSGQRRLGSIEGVGGFSVSGVASYVRGKNRTTGDDLYHIMPLNLKLALTHRLGGWTNILEAHMVEKKDRVSHVRNEVVTPGYALVNVRTSYEWKHARLDVSLENALNKFYLLPLGGAYVGQGNAMTINGVPWGMNVPGMGRSVNVALNVHF